MTNEQVIGVSVLVVDSNSTCLAIVSKMLHASGYKVITATRAIDAMHILRERRDELDLILTEVHLPDMDKYELLETMGEISNLPIVILSADNDENSILGCLFKGAEFYLLKPITMNDVKNLWQFSYIKKQEEELELEGSTNFEEESTPDNSSNEVSECLSSSDVLEQSAQKGKRKELEEMDKEKEEDNVNSTQPKKPKLIWTNELHDRFLQAIRILGIDSAHPKKILKRMNVPGLKKENISSHLQKYRLALKREQEAIRRTMIGDYHISQFNWRGVFKSHKPLLLRTSKTEFRSCVQNRKNLNGSSMSMPCLDSTNFPMDLDSNHNDISIPKFAELSPQNDEIYSASIKNSSNGELRILDPMRSDNAEEFGEQRSTFYDASNCGFESTTDSKESLGNSSQQRQHLLPPLSPQLQWEQREDDIFEAEMGDTCMPAGSTDIFQDNDACNGFR